MSTSPGHFNSCSVQAYKNLAAKDLEGFEISDSKGAAALMGASQGMVVASHDYWVDHTFQIDSQGEPLQKNLYAWIISSVYEASKHRVV